MRMIKEERGKGLKGTWKQSNYNDRPWNLGFLKRKLSTGSGSEAVNNGSRSFAYFLSRLFVFWC